MRDLRLIGREYRVKVSLCILFFDVFCFERLDFTIHGVCEAKCIHWIQVCYVCKERTSRDMYVSLILEESGRGGNFLRDLELLHSLSSRLDTGYATTTTDISLQ